jgi:PIN domain nuclease of toxin-antitoxin system
LQFLVDTHIAVRWLIEPRRLSREQLRRLETAVRLAQLVALSAMSLLEIAMLNGSGKLRLKASLQEFLSDLQSHPAIRLLPLTYEVASDAALLGSLRDPADRAIVATARVHRLRLLTSDQQIIDSKLVPIV